MTIYKVGWHGEISDMAIDVSYVEADNPEEAAQIYKEHCTSYRTVDSFHVKKPGLFRTDYVVAFIPNKSGTWVYKTVKKGWHPCAWL